MAQTAHSRDGIGTATPSGPGLTTRLLRCERWRSNNFDPAVLLR